MKYFFVSDLHGCEPSILWNALEAQYFNKDQDTLVILGDIVDRGAYVMDLIKGVNSLPHVIRVWGNHDLRTRDLILGIGPKPDRYDKHNGVGATLHSICGLSPSDKEENIWYYLHALIPGNEVARQNINEFLDHYCRRCVWAVEFSDLIATHGWLPHARSKERLTLLRAVNNLSGLPKMDWVEATWADTRACLINHIYPTKPLLVGHWWAGDIRARFGLHRSFEDMILDGSVDFSPFVYNNAIFIDSCTPVSHTVNVYVYETDEEPTVYVTDQNNLVIKKTLTEADL